MQKQGIRAFQITTALLFGVMVFAQDYYAHRRQIMVQNQLVIRGIQNERVLDAMQKVERHRFVPDDMVEKAYYDCPLPIGYGQTISQPYIVAFMTEILDIRPEDKILEIGTGSGYQAAVLSELCDSVFSIEVVAPLGVEARERLAQLGYGTIRIKIGDGYQGWSEHAPYQSIIVTCSPTHIPKALKEQLAEGGKMIIPVEQNYGQQLVLLEKNHGRLKRTQVLAVRFVPMVDTGGKKY